MTAEKAGASTIQSIFRKRNSDQKGNVLIMVLSGVNLVATIAMLVVIYLSFQREKNHASVEDISAQTIAEAEGEKGKEKGHGGGHGGGHGSEGEHKASDKKKSVDYGKMVTLEQFTVNLSTPGSVNPKFVKVNISLEVPTDDAENEVNSKMPQIRNTVIDLFNSKKSSDLATADGREYLKEEIRNALNSFLINGKIKGVFFTNFALAG
jgi:flagellar protein FliL